MRNPFSKNKTRPGLFVGSIVAASVSFLVIAALLSVNNGVLATMATFIKEVGSPNSSPISEPANESEGDPSALPSDSASEAGEQSDHQTDVVFARPAQMKGVWMIAGTDYFTKGNETGETVKSQIDAAFDKFNAWDFNTVLVPVSIDGKPLYISSVNAQTMVIKNANGGAFDALAYIRQCAKDRGVFAYGVLDLRVNAKDGPDPSTVEGARAIHNMVAEAVSLYTFDGWLLDNVGYAAGDGGSFATYMQTMPGAGFDHFLRDSVTVAVDDAVRTIKAASTNLYTGLLADAAWAHAANDERGSQTSGVYASYTDGFADTRAWVEGGLFDFVMVKNSFSTTHSAAPFSKVLDWWTSLCSKSGRSLYVAHAAYKVSGTEQGWKSPDQLAQQVLACKKVTGWSGSAFNSYAALLRDSGGSTQAALNAFGDKLNEEYISRKLAFTSPTKTTLTTNESLINIRGSADPNFPLTMNGQKVELSAHGFFSIDLSLAVGTNTYTFAHKGDTVTYKITHRVVVIQSVQPSSNISLDGSTTISISAIAFKGASVYAKLGNTTIKMKQSAIQSEENGSNSENSDYINYAGSYTLPAGTVGKEKNLGTVTVYGTYKTLGESKKGGSIVVKAKPVPPPTTTVPSNTTKTSGNNPDIDPGSSGNPVLKTGKIFVVSTDYAETFSGNTTDDWSRPVNAYLPKGTMDVYVSSTYDSASGESYYLLGSGRRVYQSDVSVYKASGSLTANKLTLGTVSADSEATKITLGAQWHIPYNLRLLPQSYGNETTQNYNITAFTASYVDITFYYTTAVPATPDVSSSPLFRSASWVKGSNNSYILRLTLRNTGAFYGYSVSWDSSGNITFRFHNPTGVTSDNKPLTGKRIVLDPGHGGKSIGTAGGTTSEKAEVLKYGLALRDKLTALGATVIMTRETDMLPDNALNPPSMAARTAHARNGNADLFLSIHMDGATSSARGFTVFYFNEYSQPFAKSISSRVETVYRNASGISGRGIKWSAYFVNRLHDCPSILIECGFMSNSKDLELLISSTYRNNFTQAMTNGIVDYFKAMPKVTTPTTTTTTSTTTEAMATTTTMIAPAGLLAVSRKRKQRVRSV